MRRVRRIGAGSFNEHLTPFVWEPLLEHSDQRLPIRKSPQIDSQPIPGHIDAPLVEEFLLVFAAGSGADQPEGPLCRC
jgi:hypothetical protein